MSKDFLFELSILRNHSWIEEILLDIRPRPALPCLALQIKKIQN